MESIISLIKLSKNSAIMARNGSALSCPFRQAEFTQVEKQTLQGRVMEYHRQEVKCGTWCPHFNLFNIPDDGGKKQTHILLTCGTSDTIHPVHEVIEPQKKN